MSFKPGDVVLLRSGGPSMTVVSVDDDEIKCVWMGEEGELFREALPPVALDRVATEDDLEEDDDDDEDDEDEDEHESEDEDERAKGRDEEEADDDADEAEDRPSRRAGRG